MLNQRNFLEPSTWKTAKNICNALIWKDVLVSQSHCCVVSVLLNKWLAWLTLSAITNHECNWCNHKLNVQPFCRQSFHSFSDCTLEEGPGQPEQSMVVFATCVLMSKLGFTVITSIHCCCSAAAATSIYCCYINYVHFLLRSAGPKGFLYGNLLRWCETRKINHSSPPTTCSNQQFWHFWQTAFLLGAVTGHKREHELSQLKRREKRAKFQAKLESELKKKDAIVQDAVATGQTSS